MEWGGIKAGNRFIGMGTLSHDSGFNVWQGLLEPVLTYYCKDPLRMSAWPWQGTEDGVRRRRDVAALEWIYYMKPRNPPPKSMCPGRANRTHQF